MKIVRVRSILPGAITVFHVDDGDRVQNGDPILAIECMKQQTDFPAPAAGVVRFKVELGDVVEQDQVLAEIETE